ncbi:MAG TPA: hypothetical protein PK095_22415, partial [Myxococcota bacterium]|nr:hypothetical protein [Myxococcota bacterium]
AEGLGKQLDPTLDIVKLSVPVIATAMLKAPPGITPKRHLPTLPKEGGEGRQVGGGASASRQ